MVEQDGVYRSEQRRVQRRKKIAVGVAGLAAILAGGGYALSTWHSARDDTVVGDTGALAPVVPSASPSGPAPVSGPPSSVAPAASVVPAPASRSASPRLSAARRSSRPTPTPVPATSSPAPVATRAPDAEVAAAQVSRLLTAPRTAPSGGVSAAGETVLVANESGADGSAIRVLSAHYDLTAGGSPVGAADAGVRVGEARCTHNLRVDGVRETRPGVLLCWRAAPDRSVVTVATRSGGGPVPATSARVIDRAWQRLG